MTLTRQRLDAEQQSAVAQLKTQLAACGMRSHTAAGALALYSSALRRGSPVAWQRFYVALFTRVERLSRRPAAPDRAALESILAILEDDLGARLFDRAALARIRRSYSEVYGRARGQEGAFASSEAYVPS